MRREAIFDSSFWVHAVYLDLVEVINTPTYLVHLYAQERVPEAQVVNDLSRLARRGTLRPAWIQVALTMVAAIRQQRKT